MIDFLLFLLNNKVYLKGLKHFNFGKRKFKNFEFSLFYKFILTNFSNLQEKYNLSFKDFWAKTSNKTHPNEKIATSKKTVEFISINENLINKKRLNIVFVSK